VDVIDLAPTRAIGSRFENVIARNDLTRLVEQAMAKLPEETADGDHPQGVTTGWTFQENRRLFGMSAEYREDASVSGPRGLAPRPWQSDQMKTQ